QELNEPVVLARIHQYLAMATPLLWIGQPDIVGALRLALNACEEGGGPEDDLALVRELVEAARSLWRALPEVHDGADPLRGRRIAFRLVQLADIVAVTSGALAHVN